MQNLAAAQRRYDRMEPVCVETREPTDSELQEALQDQIDADACAAQDIDTAFIDQQYALDEDNILRCKYVSGASDAELGALVRKLMGRVAIARLDA